MDETARFLGVSKRTAYRLRKSGELGTFAIGLRKTRVSELQIEAFLRSREKNA